MLLLLLLISERFAVDILSEARPVTGKGNPSLLVRALIEVTDVVAVGAVYGDGGKLSMALLGKNLAFLRLGAQYLGFSRHLISCSASSAAAAPSIAVPNTTAASIYLGMTIGKPVQSARSLIKRPLRH